MSNNAITSIYGCCFQIKNESTAYYEETLVYLKICSTVQTETVLSICNALRDVCHKL